jgi:hypothetical protein
MTVMGISRLADRLIARSVIVHETRYRDASIFAT